MLGVDPGTRLCGWGVVSVDAGVHHVDNGVLAVAVDKAPLATRLERIFAGLEAVIAAHRPTVVAVERVFVGHGNASTALALGHARGVVLLAAARAGLGVHAYTAQEVKKAATGSGRAGKAQVQQMVTLRFSLADVPQEDAADALAVALCHAQHLAAGVPTAPLPKKPPPGRRGRAALTAWAQAREEDG